jgi:hypothetical protein
VREINKERKKYRKKEREIKKKNTKRKKYFVKVDEPQVVVDVENGPAVEDVFAAVDGKVGPDEDGAKAEPEKEKGEPEVMLEVQDRPEVVAPPAKESRRSWISKFDIWSKKTEGDEQRKKNETIVALPAEVSK